MATTSDVSNLPVNIETQIIDPLNCDGGNVFAPGMSPDLSK